MIISNSRYKKMLNEGLINVMNKLTDLFSSKNYETRENPKRMASAPCNKEKNQVRPAKFGSDDEDDYDWNHRDIDIQDEYDQVEYEQELQYSKHWYVKKESTDFQRKHVKVVEENLDDDKFILTKFWKNEEKEKQPVAKKCLKKNYRKLNATEREQIQTRDKREKIWNVKKTCLVIYLIQR